MARPKEGYHDLFAQIPKPLWHALCADADANERSATGKLIWILKQRYPDAAQVETVSERTAKTKKGKK